MTGAHLFMPAAASAALDRSSSVPLYLQVAYQLQSLVESGAIPVGAKLGNEIELAERLGVSRPTMRRAMQFLVDRGMLVRKPGVGTQVVQPKVSRGVELSSLHDDLAGGDHHPTTAVLAFSVGPVDDETTQRLGSPPGAAFTSFDRLRCADGQPLAVMHNLVPAAVCPLDRDDLESHGLYTLLRAAGHAPFTASQSIGARQATAAEAGLLSEKRGAAVLTMTRTAWDARGLVVEYGRHIYRASRYTFDSALTASRSG